jgi:1-deoxyxylulose-5-phosphate synthase
VLGSASLAPDVPGARRVAADPTFRKAVELGITFWDTANVYRADSSEEIMGRAIQG